MKLRIRRRKRRNDLKSTAALILEEAADLIAVHGVDGLRLEEISRRLGISRPALYQHYPNGRAQILERLAMDAVGVLVPLFAEHRVDPLEQLLAGIRSMVRALAASPALMRLLLRDLSAPGGMPELTRQIGPPGFADRQGILRPMHDRLARLIDTLHRAGRARVVSSHAVLNVALGTTLLSIVHPPFKTNVSAPAATRKIEGLVSDLVVRFLANVDLPVSSHGRNSASKPRVRIVAGT